MTKGVIVKCYNIFNRKLIAMFSEQRKAKEKVMDNMNGNYNENYNGNYSGKKDDGGVGW